MSERIVAWFPFVIAVLLPLAGLVYGLVQIGMGERDFGLRIMGVSIVAGVAQALIFL
jgi:hypothetical protein